VVGVAVEFRHGVHDCGGVLSFVVGLAGVKRGDVEGNNNTSFPSSPFALPRPSSRAAALLNSS
jgi:hypothetical protein